MPGFFYAQYSHLYLVKVLNAEQVRAADAQTIKNEPILSIDLMERAATRFTQSFWALVACGKLPKPSKCKVLVLCGMGNNGGDGLVVARLLKQEGVMPTVWVAHHTEQGSPDYQTNLQRLIDVGIQPVFMKEEWPVIEADILIDALFGSGLVRPIGGWLAKLVMAVNKSAAAVVAVDMPSGLFSEDNRQNEHKHIICADHTLTFQVPKLALLLPENHVFVGEWQTIPIGLDEEFIASLETGFTLIDKELLRPLLRPRPRVAHKGSFGHALLLAGSKGKIGAAVLATRACVRSGVGLCTVHTPVCGLDVLQTAVPAAMCSVDEEEEFISAPPDLAAYQTVGAGPGLGQDQQTANALKLLIQNTQVPMVIDADALNILAENPTWMAFLPKSSILTPHPKEFERMAGSFDSDLDRLEGAREMARKNALVIVLKSAYTSVCTPDGKVYFNNRGNSGMATGGSGDVLTGLITGLVAQGYPPEQAAILGVFWHGTAGDVAARHLGEPSMTAMDLVQYMGHAWIELTSSSSPGFPDLPEQLPVEGR